MKKLYLVIILLCTMCGVATPLPLDFFKQFKSTPDETFTLANLTYDADIQLGADEFGYLVDLPIGSVITVKQVKKACRALAQKDRFKKIFVTYAARDNGLALHIHLKSYWIFKKLDLTGIWWGKHRYTDLYVTQPGDLFDKAAHDSSVATISQELQNNGYLKAVVQDRCSYDKHNKTVSVHLKMIPYRRFRIHKVEFELKGLDKKLSTMVHERLHKRFASSMQRSNYSRSLVVKVVERIKLFMERLGYCHSRVVVSRGVSSEKNLVTLRFSIDPGSKRSLSFSGNKLITSGFILSEILGKDYPDWLADPEIIAEQIIHHYYKKGYWKTVVTYTKKAEQSYHFSINEGPQLPLSCVECVDEKGNQLRDDYELFAPLVQQGKYDEELLDQTCAQLVARYKKKGFYSCAMRSKKMNPAADGSLVLSVVLFKGEQRLLHEIRCLPEEVATTYKEFLKKYVAVHDPAIPCDQSLLQAYRHEMVNFFQNEGFWFVEVTYDQQKYVAPDTSQQGGLTDVTFTINLKKPVTFGKVLIKGSTRLPFKRILKELAFKPGEPWDRKKIELSRKKLKRLGIFKHAHIQPHKTAAQGGDRPVTISLLEDEPFEVQFRLGYFVASKNLFPKHDSTVQGGGSFIIKNPFNCADRIIFDANVTRFERDFNVAYQVPQLFNLDCSGRIKGFFHSFDQPTSEGSSTIAYRATNNGFALGFDKEFKLGSHLGLTAGTEWMKTSHAHGVLNLAPSMVDRTIPYLFCEPACMFDTLDDALNPSKGTLSVCSLKMLVPCRNAGVSFRLQLENSFFWPLSPRVVGAFRIRLGHLFNRSFDHIMPVERFYLGGPFSVRGYEKDSVPPYGVKIIRKDDGTVAREYTIQGGRSMINTNLELRFQLYGSLGLVAFQDLGILSQSGWSGLKGRWYPTSGVGVRYNLPFGALRFDIGWKWRRSVPEERSYAWYLTFGQAF